MKSKSKVAIVVLNYNGLEDTLACIESLSRIDYQNYEIFIVDNNSIGDDYQVLKDKIKDDRCIFLKNKENLGFAEGNNVVIKKILQENNFDFILLLNNDVVVDSYFLTHLINFYEENPHLGSVGSKILNYYNRTEIDSLSIKISPRGGGLDEGKGSKYNVSENKIVFGISGCCLLFKASVAEEVIKKTGYFFDPDFFLYYEDVDLAWRLNLLDYQSGFCYKSRIYHKGSSTSGKFTSFKSFYVMRNRLYIIFKYYPFKKIIKSLYLINIKNFERSKSLVSKRQGSIFMSKILDNNSKMLVLRTLFGSYLSFIFNIHKILYKRITFKKEISNKDLNNLFLKWEEREI
jgi:GT2 family glycosyltransferase